MAAVCKHERGRVGSDVGWFRFFIVRSIDRTLARSSRVSSSLDQSGSRTWRVRRRTKSGGLRAAARELSSCGPTWGDHDPAINDLGICGSRWRHGGARTQHDPRVDWTHAGPAPGEFVGLGSRISIFLLTYMQYPIASQSHFCRMCC